MPFNTDCACVRCGASLIGVTETAVAECDDYIHNPPPWAEGRAVFRYQGLARKMILELKHGDRPELAAPAAAWMLQIASDILTEKSLIIPIPVHWQRFLQRKYNQAAVLAKHVAKHSGAELKPDILRRPRKTAPLKQFNRSGRFAILENAFEINPDKMQEIRERNIVLIDDVITPGATLSAATKTLQQAGACDISVLVLARVTENA
jgi:ComF family protein